VRGVLSLKIVVVTGVKQSKEGELPQKGDYRSVSMLSGKTILSVNRESRDEAKVKPRFAPRGEKLGKTRRREVLSKVCVRRTLYVCTQRIDAQQR